MGKYPGEAWNCETSSVLVVDGGDRFLSNGYNLWRDIFPENNTYRIPTSIGAQIGSNFGINGEKWGGIIDDGLVMFMTGGPLQDGIEGIDNFSNLDYGRGLTSMYNAYDGINIIHEDVKNIVGN